MNPFALFLIVIGAGLLFGSAFSEAPVWRVLAFIGGTLGVAGFAIEYVTTRPRKKQRR